MVWRSISFIPSTSGKYDWTKVEFRYTNLNRSVDQKPYYKP